MANGPYMGAIGLCFCITVIWLSITWREHPSFVRPVHAALSASFVAGFALVAISRTKIPTFIGRGRGGAGREYRSHEAYLSAPSTQAQLVGPMLVTPQRRRLNFIVLVLCIIIRVGTLRKISEASQCSAANLEFISLPVIFAIYDFAISPLNYDADDVRDAISNSAFEDLFDTIRWSRIRYIPPTIMLTLGIYLTASRLPSAYICAEVLHERNYTIFLQVFGIGLDSTIIIVLSQLLASCNDDRRRAGMLGYVMIASAAVLSVASLLYLVLHPFSIMESLTISPAFKYSVFIDGLALTLLLFCIGYLSSDLRPFAFVFTVTFASAAAPLVKTALAEMRPFPPQSNATRIIGIALLFLGYSSFFIIYKYAETAKHPQNILHRVHILFNIGLVTAFIYTEFLYIVRSNKAGFHPVRLSLYQSQINADVWTKQASSSDSLRVAVNEYKARYHRVPPPNFDKWYEFAIARNCTIIDDYDQIYDDLLPFWGLQPSLIRKRSTVMLKQSGFISISIDKSKVDAIHVSEESSQLDIPITNMIKSFSSWLPQMQLVLNPGRSPQVAVPHSSIASLEVAGRRSEHIQAQESLITTWATLSDWGSSKTVGSGEIISTATKHISRWDDYMASTCPPYSPARSYPHSSRTLCTSCFAPYSVGQFLHNISLSLNPCLQPDLRTISSFLSAPSTVTNTGYPADTLIPVFSPRKIEGYNDILFPFPGTYVSTRPRPIPNNKSFDELHDVLYWRGKAPPSGLGANDWQGVSEQRLVALANPVSSHEKIPILLPLDTEGIRHEYGYVGLATIADQIKVDAGFTAIPEENCHRLDECRLQREEFGYVVNLSSEDEEKYSNRYLLTTDVSESEEFLTNILSNSAAVRSGIFKSWYEDRLTPWLHYIPLDMRWQGLHSTMAYFVGLSGVVRGKEVSMNSEAKEGKWIAEQGKKRAEAIIREADAEVYLFRLLLEWGRILDDNRDEVGFDVK